MELSRAHILTDYHDDIVDSDGFWDRSRERDVEEDDLEVSRTSSQPELGKLDNGNAWLILTSPFSSLPRPAPDSRQLFLRGPPAQDATTTVLDCGDHRHPGLPYLAGFVLEDFRVKASLERCTSE
jgi:hypothetical protein